MSIHHSHAMGRPKSKTEGMTIEDAISVYLYLKDARPAERDANPIYRQAANIIGKYAETVISRTLEARKE